MPERKRVRGGLTPPVRPGVAPPIREEKPTPIPPTVVEQAESQKVPTQRKKPRVAASGQSTPETD